MEKGSAVCHDRPSSSGPPRKYFHKSCVACAVTKVLDASGRAPGRREITGSRRRPSRWQKERLTERHAGQQLTSWPEIALILSSVFTELRRLTASAHRLIEAQTQLNHGPISRLMLPQINLFTENCRILLKHANLTILFMSLKYTCIYIGIVFL